MNEANLPLARYRLVCEAKDDIHLPAYSGSAWRGLFGHALKQAVCVTREPSCEPCMLYRNCVYSYVFETPPPADTAVMRKYPSVPHPYVLMPEPDQATAVKPGDTLSVYLTLLGKANQHLPYLLHSFEKAGERGLSASQGRFKVTALAQQQLTQWQTIYKSGGVLQALAPTVGEVPPCPDGVVTLRFITPLRLRLQNREITHATFSFYALFSVLMRRISMLQTFHADQPLDLDFKGLSAAAREVPILSNKLRWQDWSRYSSRQKTPVKMGGLVGEITLDGALLQPFWALLYLGQSVHVGKGTVMGLGHYQISH